jgi:hypothetical protein
LIAGIYASKNAPLRITTSRKNCAGLRRNQKFSITAFSFRLGPPMAFKISDIADFLRKHLIIPEMTSVVVRQLPGLNVESKQVAEFILFSHKK